MTRRTRRLLLLALPAALVTAALTGWLLWSRTAITAANAARIEKGMTLAEVEALLGGPARDEAPDHPRENLLRGVRPDHEWHSQFVTVNLYLDSDGRVREYRATLPPRPPGPLDVLRRWLGL
jgi:hypothetical protein